MIKLILLSSFVLMFSACGQSFQKKPNQTLSQFQTDSHYCRSEANGVWQNEAGSTTVGIRSRKMGYQTYEDCMRALGYQQSKKIDF